MGVLLFSSRKPWPDGRSSYPGRRVVREPFDPDLEALRSGNEAAFEALIGRYHGSMLRLAVSYLRDRGAAEDAVQETWLTCLRTLDRFEGRSSLKTWIFGILLNVCRARRRKESRIQPFTSLFRRLAGEGRGPTVDPHRFDGHGEWLARPDNWSNVPESRMLSRETIGPGEGGDRRPAGSAARGRDLERRRRLRRRRGMHAAFDLAGEPEGATPPRPGVGAQGTRGVPAMRCREVVELMTAYLDGALSAADRAKFEKHISGCDGCRAYLAQLRTARMLMGRVADEPMAEPLKAELMNAFRNWKAS